MGLVDDIFGGGDGIDIDPLAIIEAQKQANIEALLRGFEISQQGQVTPFGTVSFTGEVGTPDRLRTIGLVPGLEAFAQQQIGGLTGLPQLSPLIGEDARQRVGQATTNRILGLLEPSFQQQEARLLNDLRQRGLARGGEAFETELANLRRSQGEQRLAAALEGEVRGGAEQARQFDITRLARGQPLTELGAVSGLAPNPGQIPTAFPSPANVLGAESLGLQAQQIENAGRSGLLQSLLPLAGTIAGGFFGGPAGAAGTIFGGPATPPIMPTFRNPISGSFRLPNFTGF